MKTSTMILQFLSCFLYPFRLHKVDKRWDKKLNDLINDCQNLERRSGFSVAINGVSVWVSNWPYSYGSPRNIDILPTRKTALRLRLWLYEKEGVIWTPEKWDIEQDLAKVLDVKN